MDAPQHIEAELLDKEATEPFTDKSGEITVVSPSYPDAQHQLANVENDTERISKDIFGEGKTLLSLLGHSPKLRTNILLLQKDNPHLLLLDEPTFKKEHKTLITLITQRLRIGLWQEFELAHLNNRPMRARQIFAGICTENTFYNMIENPIRLAYVLLAPTDYIIMLKEAHDAGLDKLRELFSAKIIDEEGYMNPKAADMVIKAFALLDSRLKGAIVQRVDQRVLTAQMSDSKGGVGIPRDMEALDQEIQRARAQIAKYNASFKSPTVEELSRVVESGEVELNVIDVGANGTQKSAKVMG